MGRPVCKQLFVRLRQPVHGTNVRGSPHGPARGGVKDQEMQIPRQVAGQDQRDRENDRGRRADQHTKCDAISLHLVKKKGSGGVRVKRKCMPGFFPMQ